MFLLSVFNFCEDKTDTCFTILKGLVFLGLFSLHKNPSGDVGTINPNVHLEFLILRPSEAYESTTFWFAKPPTKISLQLK